MLVEEATNGSKRNRFGIEFFPDKPAQLFWKRTKEKNGFTLFSM
jgi:hypothetical protein